MKLQLRLFNVGQGDHMLLELPDGSFGVFDFFYSASKGWTLPPTCIFLENLRKQDPKRQIKIAFICISHPDIDHIKGLKEFLDWINKYKIPLAQIWRYPGYNPGEMKEFLEKALEKSKFIEGALGNNRLLSPNLDALDKYIKKNKKQTRVAYLKEVREISNKIGGLVDAKCLAPLEKHTNSITGDFWVKFFQAYLERKKMNWAKKNNLSSIVQLIFGEFNLLFGGDTELNVWTDCMEHCELNNLTISWQPDFIKLSHHGSKNSSSEELWKTLLSKPSTFVGISAWKKMHPHKDTIQHIIQAAEITKNDYKILGTSICTNCAKNAPFPSSDASWITETERDTYDEHALKELRSKDYRECPNSERLISYILTFSLTDSSISVKKEISPTNIAQHCIYKNPDSKNFPQCVI